MALPSLCVRRWHARCQWCLALLPVEGEGYPVSFDGQKYRDTLTGCAVHRALVSRFDASLCRLGRDCGGLWPGLTVSNYEHRGQA